MSKLQAALNWAARGFRVFPLLPNSKEPVHSEEWYNHATTDPDKIRSMWRMPVIGGEFDYNIGVDCTDMVVVDVDTKEGKNGHHEYVSLGGTYETLVIRTPTGGFHCYFQGPDSSNASIASAVDIRSHHGYVVGPGSTIDGVPYTVITDREPEWIPLAIDKLVKPPYTRRETTHENYDNPAAIQAGINFLESVAPAIEGQRGDDHTFQVAARLVREYALSPPTALALLLEHWNPRCLPPWLPDELAQKVDNAFAYASAEIGRQDPSVVFQNVRVEPPPSVFAQSNLAWGNAMLPASIIARPWIIDRMLMRGKVTIVGASGSAGKSSLGLAIAAHGAVGKDFGAFKSMGGPFSSIIFNGEDEIEEQSRRLIALCSAYGLDFDVVRQRVFLMSYEEAEIKLVSAEGRKYIRNTPVIDQLIDLCRDGPDVGMLLLDPLVDLHTCDESDSTAMNEVMAVMQSIARRANIGVMVMHHTTKNSGERQESRIGNADAFRGSSGIVNKSRVAFTLMDASASDVEDYDMQTDERHLWVRLDDAKMNISAKTNKPVWFKKIGVRIASGDIVGVLHYQELNKGTTQLRIRMADVLIQTMLANGSGSLTIMQAVAVLKGGEPIMANKKDTEVKAKLVEMFSTPVDIRGRTLHVRKEGSDMKGNLIVVME